MYGKVLAKALSYRKSYPANTIPEYRLVKTSEQDSDYEGEFKVDLSIGSEEWSLDELAKEYAAKYDIKNWININTVITVSFNEWVKFDPIVKRAIVNEINEIVEARNREAQKREKDIEMQMAKVNSEIKIKDISNTAIGKLMSR